MIATPIAPLVDAQYRLARYYLDRLRAADAAFRRGHENALSGLTLLDCEWSQIRQWQTWAAQHATEDAAIARLCVAFTHVGEDILLLRQTPSEWLQWLDGGLRAAVFLSDSSAEMLHRFLLGRVHMLLGASERALAWAESALTLAREQNNSLYMCRSLNLLGSLFHMQDRYDRSKMVYEQALALSRELDAKPELGVALNGLGNIAMTQSRLQQALEYYTDYLQIAETLGRTNDIAAALYNLGQALLQMGDYSMATASAERCVMLCRSVRNHRFLAEALGLLGQLASARENLLEAQSYYEQSLKVSHEIGYRLNEAFMLLQLGYLHYQLGQVAVALDNLEASFALATAIGDRWYRALAVRSMAEVFRGTGDLPHAHQKLSEGLEIVRTFESGAIRAKYLLQAASIWHDEGNVEQAALWTGLLEQHTQGLNAEQRRRLAELRSGLEAQIAPEEFRALLECGKTLNLVKEIEKITSTSTHAVF